VSELYRPSDRCLSAKWLPTFTDRGCHVVSVTDPYGRILGLNMTTWKEKKYKLEWRKYSCHNRCNCFTFQRPILDNVTKLRRHPAGPTKYGKSTESLWYLRGNPSPMVMKETAITLICRMYPFYLNTLYSWLTIQSCTGPFNMQILYFLISIRSSTWHPTEMAHLNLIKTI
jgi:hypothetical protein